MQHGTLKVSEPQAVPPSHASLEALTSVSRHESRQGHPSGRAGRSSLGTGRSCKSCTYARHRTWYCSDSRAATSTPPSSCKRLRTKILRPSPFPARSSNGAAGADPSPRCYCLHMFSNTTGTPRARSTEDVLEMCSVDTGWVDSLPVVLGAYVRESIVLSSSSPLRGKKTSRIMADCSRRALPVTGRLLDGARAGHILRRSKMRFANIFCNARHMASCCCQATACNTSRPCRA